MSVAESSPTTCNKPADVQEEVKNEEKKVDEEYNDEAADAVVISSDGKHFRVYSFFLKAASAVFRTMIDDCTSTSPEIRLTDDDFESSQPLKMLLDLVCNKPFDNFNLLDCGDVLKLIRLAGKWDFPTVTRTISLHTAQSFSKNKDSHHLFYYACALDDPYLAHRLLPAAAKMKWNTGVPGTPSVHKVVIGSHCLDVNTMTSLWIDRLPRKYFLALLRASRLRLLEPKGSWDSVADEFRDLVKEQDMEPS